MNSYIQLISWCSHSIFYACLWTYLPLKVRHFNRTALPSGYPASLHPTQVVGASGALPGLTWPGLEHGNS